jgi:antitoxin FitA
MTQVVVRNIENAIKVGLRRRAQRNGCSLEDEIRDILRRAVAEEAPSTGGLESEIAGLFSKLGLEADIPELRS